MVAASRRRTAAVRTETADAGQGRDARRPGALIKSGYPEDEVGTVGEVEIVDACRDTGFDHVIGLGTVILEWS